MKEKNKEDGILWWHIVIDYYFGFSCTPLKVWKLFNYVRRYEVLVIDVCNNGEKCEIQIEWLEFVKGRSWIVEIIVLSGKKRLKGRVIMERLKLYAILLFLYEFHMVVPKIYMIILMNSALWGLHHFLVQKCADSCCQLWRWQATSNLGTTCILIFWKAMLHPHHQKSIYSNTCSAYHSTFPKTTIQILFSHFYTFKFPSSITTSRTNNSLYHNLWFILSKLIIIITIWLVFFFSLYECSVPFGHDP